MDTSGSELQELRQLLSELTARVFRIERALNLQPGLAEPPPAPKAPAPPGPGVELTPPEPVSPRIPPKPAKISLSKPGAGSGIPHWFALAEPDRHCRRADRRFVLPEICLRQQLDRTSRPRHHRTAGRNCRRGLERELSQPRIPPLFLLLEGRRHRCPLPLAVRGFPGLQPGARQCGLRHDVDRDCGYGPDGMDPGRGNSGSVCPDRRIQQLRCCSPPARTVKLPCSPTLPFWTWAHWRW